MSNYCFSIILCLVFIFMFGTFVLADTPVVPWSKVISSPNEKFKLVLISPKITEQSDYVSRLKEFWKKGGIPSEWIPKAERKLQEEIDQERKIRKQYPESGLYTSSNLPQLLWKIDLYDTESWYLVSDDGEHLVVVKDNISGIKEERSIEGNPQVKEIVKSVPDMSQVILTFYRFGKLIRSYKATELIEDNDLLRTTSYDFMWNDKRVLNEKEKTISITKKSGEELIFDMNGNLLSGKLLSQPNSTSTSGVENVQPLKSENNKSFCGGIALLVGLVLSLLFDR